MRQLQATRRRRRRQGHATRGRVHAHALAPRTCQHKLASHTGASCAEARASRWEGAAAAAAAARSWADELRMRASAIAAPGAASWNTGPARGNTRLALQCAVVQRHGLTSMESVVFSPSRHTSADRQAHRQRQPCTLAGAFAGCASPCDATQLLARVLRTHARVTPLARPARPNNSPPGPVLCCGTALIFGSAWPAAPPRRAAA